MSDEEGSVGDEESLSEPEAWQVASEGEASFDDSSRASGSSNEEEEGEENDEVNDVGSSSGAHENPEGETHAATELDDEIRSMIMEVYQELEAEAELEGLKRRNTVRRSVTPSKRHKCMTPEMMEEAHALAESIAIRRYCEAHDCEVPEAYESLLIEEADVESQKESLKRLVFEDPHEDEVQRRRRKSHFRKVSEAFIHFEESEALFEGVFGFLPHEVTKMAEHLFENEKIVIKGARYPAELCLLVVLARLTQAVTSWDLLAFLFGRSDRDLRRIFQATVQTVLDDFDWLIASSEFERFASIQSRCEEAVLAKYRQVRRNPQDSLPDRYRGVCCFMDGCRFQICRPGAGQGANVQQSFYSKKYGHCINTLMIVLQNGIRAAFEFSSGRRADPALLTEELKSNLREARFVVLGDAIFGKSDVIRGLERRSKATIPAEKNKSVSAIRIPVEWSFADLKQQFPLVTAWQKLKIFGTKPVSIIQLAVLFSNFKTCFRGSNSSKYFKMRPPKFEDYIAGGV